MKAKITQLVLWKARIKNFLRGDLLRAKKMTATMEMNVSLARRQESDKICFVGNDSFVIKKRFGGDISFLHRFKKYNFSVNKEFMEGDLVLLYCKSMSVEQSVKRIVEFYVGASSIVCVCENRKKAQEIDKSLNDDGIKKLFAGSGEGQEYLLIFDKNVVENSEVSSGLDSRLCRNDRLLKYGKNDDLKIQAIVTCYNEGDIIEHTIRYLIEQGIYVHIIDNWSTDNSINIINEFVRNSKFVTSEKFPIDGPSETYDWGDILNRVQTVAMKNSDKFDWFVHHDADEVREAFFKKIKSLKKGIEIVDNSGFNAIDHTVINFALTKDGFDGIQNLEEWFEYFEFGKKEDFHHKQIKAWKSNLKIDLTSSGGHIAQFSNMKVFPYNFLLKHYPLRSVKQAQKKIFQERKNRWNEEEKEEKKWHKQYDDINDGYNFLRPVDDSMIYYNRKKVYDEHLMQMIVGEDS